MPENKHKALSYNSRVGIIDTERQVLLDDRLRRVGRNVVKLGLPFYLLFY